MRQVQTLAPGHMQVTDGPDPEPGPGEALVRVEVVGICGSDYHLFDGSHPYGAYPLVQGHEVVGVVEGYGPDAPDAAPPPGTRVAVEPLVPCGQCFACRRDRPNCCPRLRVLGVHLPGGLAELMVAPAERLYPVGDVPPDVAVLVEPLSIGLQAVARGAVAAGDDVVVLGAGPIGLAIALGAADRGARVLVADRIASRLDLAAALGATRTVDTTHTALAAAVDAFTGGDGAAVVLDATGAPSLIRAAVDLVAPSGTVVVAGISPGTVEIPVTEFSRKELTIAGSRNNAGLFGTAVDLVQRHRDPVARLVTNSCPLEEAPDAIRYAMAHPHEVEKVIIRLAGPA